jgi:LPS-assembly lipoprotein
MSSSDRRRLVALLALLAALPAAACGFAPVHGPGGAAEGLLGRIRPEAPQDRLEFAFAARIEDRLGRADAADLLLGYAIAVEETGAGISPGNVIRRYRLHGRLDWTLGPRGGGAALASGTLSTFTAYSATGTTVATLTARRDAEERLAVILADLLVAELSARAPELPR